MLGSEVVHLTHAFEGSVLPVVNNFFGEMGVGYDLIGGETIPRDIISNTNLPRKIGYPGRINRYARTMQRHIIDRHPVTQKWFALGIVLFDQLIQPTFTHWYSVWFAP